MINDVVSASIPRVSRLQTRVMMIELVWVFIADIFSVSNKNHIQSCAASGAIIQKGAEHVKLYIC